jgi:hypothetical protein
MQGMWFWALPKAIVVVFAAKHRKERLALWELISPWAFYGARYLKGSQNALPDFSQNVPCCFPPP